MEPVIELEAALVDIAIAIIENEPYQRGTKDSGKGQGNDEVGIGHIRQAEHRNAVGGRIRKQ